MDYELLREALKGQKEPWRLFFDMDGVLVDFDKEFQKHMPGMTEEDDWAWEELHVLCPDIYAIAPPMPDLEEFLQGVCTYWQEHYILTAIPKRWNWPEVTAHKRGWVNKYIPHITDDKIRFGPYAIDKQFHCTGPRDILIDDKIRNIEQWRARGGTGIHHTSAANTIAQLKALGL